MRRQQRTRTKFNKSHVEISLADSKAVKHKTLGNRTSKTENLARSIRFSWNSSSLGLQYSLAQILLS